MNTRLQLARRVEGRAVMIPFARRMVVGRHPRCDLRVTDKEVSKMHCVLERTDFGLMVHDLNSQNGTFVNGLKIGTIELRGGDTVVVGKTKLFVVEASAQENAQVDRISAIVPGDQNPFALSVEALEQMSVEIDRMEKEARAAAAGLHEVTTEAQFEQVQALRTRHRKLGELKDYRDEVIQLREVKTVCIEAARAAGRICGAEESALFVTGKGGALECKAQVQRVKTPDGVDVPQPLIDHAAWSKEATVVAGAFAMPLLEGDEVRAVVFCRMPGTDTPALIDDAPLLREVWRIAAAVLEEC